MKKETKKEIKEKKKEIKEKKESKTKKPRKAFTLIELLAVIIILGILMIIAIPSVSNYISNSRKNAYVDTALQYVNAAKVAVNGEKYTFYDTDTTYYLHINNLKMEKGELKSPYAEFEDAYVVVAYNGSNTKPFEYYWASKDKVGNRFDLIDSEKITIDDMYNNVTRPLNNKAPIGTRNKVVIIDKDGNYINASQVIEITSEEADKCYSYEFLDNKTVKLTYYNKTCGTDVRIPGIIDGYTVTEIYAYTFYNMGLTSVVIPGSVKTIGSRAFASNKLTNVVLPEGLTKIDSEAFLNNKLPSIYLPDGLKTIGARAFKTNLITHYDIPNSVTSLGNCSFCNNPIENPNFLYVKTNGQDDYTRIRGYMGDLSEFKDKKFIIPQEVNGVALKQIESSAFYSMGLSDWEVVIPNTVTSIGSSAFAQNGIAKVNLPTSLTTIGSSAFYSNRLTELSIPDTVTSIGSLAFNGNKVTSGTDIWIYKRTKTGIDYSTLIGYSGENRKNIVIPEEKNGIELEVIASSALRYLGLTGSIKIPESVREIGSLAFCHNDLTSVDNGDGDLTGPFVYKRTGRGEFDKTSLLTYAGYNKSNVTIPSQVTRIEDYAFYYSYTKSVNIPEGVTYIGNNAFELCKLSGTVVIPSSVETIGKDAFKKQITWTSMNGNLKRIVNKTDREFDWQLITSGPEKATFKVGTVKNWYGNIEVVDSE